MEDMTDEELLDAINRGMRVVVERFRAQNEAAELAEKALANPGPPDTAEVKRPEFSSLAG